MSNSLSASFPEVWAREQQEVFYKENVAMKIANYQTGLEGKKFGDTLNRIYRNMSAYADVYTGADTSIEDLTDTAEQLVINRKFSKTFYVDAMDDIQSAYSEALNYGKDTGEYLSNQVDADLLGEVLNAGTTITKTTIATTDMLGILTGVNKALRKNNIMSKDKYGVISPEFEEILIQYVAGRATIDGDQVGRNGYLMSYLGFDFYVSNQLTSTATLVVDADITANDTITIQGQVFTFVSSIGTTAGNVLLGANAAASRVNLAALLNAPGTTTSTGVALTGDALKMFKARISAVNNIAATNVVVTGKGLGVLDVSETITAASDVWTATAQLQHNLFGVKGHPYLIMQKAPKVTERDAQLRDGKVIINTLLFGTKTFADDAKCMVDVAIQASTYNA